MSEKLDPELEAMARASGEAVARLRDLELRAYFNTPKISYKPETKMEKTDAELIATAEQWKPEGGVLDSFALAVNTMKELARRLKAANERADEHARSITAASSLISDLRDELTQVWYSYSVELANKPKPPPPS